MSWHSSIEWPWNDFTTFRLKHWNFVYRLLVCYLMPFVMYLILFQMWWYGEECCHWLILTGKLRQGGGFFWYVLCCACKKASFVSNNLWAIICENIFECFSQKLNSVYAAVSWHFKHHVIVCQINWFRCFVILIWCFGWLIWWNYMHTGVASVWDTAWDTVTYSALAYLIVANQKVKLEGVMQYSSWIVHQIISALMEVWYAIHDEYCRCCNNSHSKR